VFQQNQFQDSDLNRYSRTSRRTHDRLHGEKMEVRLESLVNWEQKSVNDTWTGCSLLLGNRAGILRLVATLATTDIVTSDVLHIGHRKSLSREIPVGCQQEDLNETQNVFMRNTTLRRTCNSQEA
jgi:hypothetical protein